MGFSIIIFTKPLELMLNEQYNVLIMNLKNSIMMIAGIVLAFLAPIVPLLILVGVAIAADTIFGIIRAKKLKQKITSRKMSQIVYKMVLYQGAVVLFYCIEHFILSDIIGLFTSVPLILTKLVTATLLSIELTSVSENVESAYGINLWKKFKEMVSRAKQVKEELEDFKDDESN